MMTEVFNVAERNYNLRSEAHFKRENVNSAHYGVKSAPFRTKNLGCSTPKY